MKAAVNPSIATSLKPAAGGALRRGHLQHPEGGAGQPSQPSQPRKPAVQRGGQHVGQRMKAVGITARLHGCMEMCTEQCMQLRGPGTPRQQTSMRGDGSGAQFGWRCVLVLLCGIQSHAPVLGQSPALQLGPPSLQGVAPNGTPAAGAPPPRWRRHAGPKGQNPYSPARGRRGGNSQHAAPHSHWRSGRPAAPRP